LITVALSITIGASAEQVWRALMDPAERATWDERILGEVAPAPDAPRRDGSRRKSRGDDLPRRVRWRYRLGEVPLVMQDDLLSADPFERMVNRIGIGSMHFDQTLTLFSEDDETGPHTRLGMKLVARNSIAVIGAVIPRLDVQKLVIEYVDTTLRQIQKYCER
jgi:hypothetical protein